MGLKGGEGRGDSRITGPEVDEESMSSAQLLSGGETTLCLCLG
jgi:hypothetical protein